MKKLIALTFAVVLALATIAPVLADQPPGQLGYEGQPGNQGGASGQPGNNGTSNGLQGYEGQPGNQGG